MRDYKNFQNINMFLSSIDKMNPYFKNASNNRKFSKHKEIASKKMNQTEDYSNQNLSKKEKKYELNYDKLYFNTDKKLFKKILDNKMRCIVYSLKFIEIKEMPKLLCLNKTYNEKFLKLVYKNILIKYRNMDLKTHIAIWKIILGYSKIKKIIIIKKFLSKFTKIKLKRMKKI